LAIENVAAVATRVHPPVHHCLSVRIAERHVLGQATIDIADVSGAVAERRKTRVGNGVRHLLKPRHVLGLDLRHPIELRIVAERTETLMLSLRINYGVDARLSRTVCASI